MATGASRTDGQPAATGQPCRRFGPPPALSAAGARTGLDRTQAPVVAIQGPLRGAAPPGRSRSCSRRRPTYRTLCQSPAWFGRGLLDAEVSGRSRRGASPAAGRRRQTRSIAAVWPRFDPEERIGGQNGCDPPGPGGRWSWRGRRGVAAELEALDREETAVVETWTWCGRAREGAGGSGNGGPQRRRL